MNPDVPRNKKKKRGVRLAIAYAMQALIALLALTLISLLVCGVMYVHEHLAQDPAEGTQKGDTAADPVVSHGKEEEPKPEGPVDSSCVVVLDAGHGGIQPGCVLDGVLEKDITLAVALLTAEKLRTMGVTVILTRETDMDVSLEERCRIANDADAALFVSIHCNSFEDTSISGFEGYYHDSADGKRLAEYIMNAADALSIKTRNVKDENYQVLRDTAMPSALMEIGFLSNPNERAELQTADYRNTIAQAIADGIARMLGK